ncbi:hypothetical protein I4902_17325 [Proteus alimentorum]|uniref:Uncharacterized protein n=1 Tax=Proteus alimentorum TaxID=1973495 RepID=A0ABS0IYG6_9GAMM|nr:hypothetical protein [Proteus alimentorum]MBG2877520.1 hypothetical protein [Proteus alimentorum]MBG2881013.1 hypothetical protein [Proteus alimentorum]
MKKYSYSQLFSYTFSILFIIAVFFYWKFEIKEYVIISSVSIKIALVISVIISLIFFFFIYKKPTFNKKVKNLLFFTFALTMIIFIIEYFMISNIVYFTSGEISSYNSSYSYVEGRRSCSGIKVNDESEGEVKVCTKIVYGNIDETGNAVVFKKTNVLGFELISAKTY